MNRTDPMQSRTHRATRFGILCAFSLSATLAQAQTTDAPASPANDLELIRAKASTDPSLTAMLNQSVNFQSNNGQ